MDAAVAALIGALGGAAIGVAGGVVTTRVTVSGQRTTAREARNEDRRARAYLEVSAFLAEVRNEVNAAMAENRIPFAGEAAETLGKASRQAAANMVYCSRSVRVAFLEFSGAILKLIDVSPAAPMPVPREEAATLQAMFNGVHRSITALSDLMSEELHPG